ncbi:DNA-directed RNA polymerase [Ralstonia phage p2106]|uniref:DNA-directed RNA polymerase n=1 Tax=Ralstonia phage p2106 TaxID=2998497 RepID=A0AAF0AGW3_9CAUD|nr:DNA-directed RNA polymerase [Ralstonia phage p2106]
MSDALQTLTELYGPDLAEAQRAIEAEAYEIGAQRFLAAMQAKAERGEGADTKVARPLIADLIPKVETAINEFIETAFSGKAGKKHTAAKLMAKVNSNRVAFIALRVVLNALAQVSGGSGSKKLPTLISVTMQVGHDIEDEARFGRIRDENEKRYKDNIAVNIAQRSGDHFKRAYARAVEVAMQDAGELQEWDGWSNQDRAAVGLKLVELIIESTGLIELAHEHKGNPKLHRVVIGISDLYAEWLAKRTHSLADMTPAFAPCVVPPKPWVGNRAGGYWFNEDKSPLMLVRGSVRRNRRYKDVDLTNVLASLNAIQNTPWTINAKVLAVAEEVAKWPNPPVKKMPSHETLQKPDRLEGMDEDEAALKAWKKQAALAYRKEKARRSRRYQLETSLQQARKYAGFERLWFPYSLDFRGRIYAATKFSPQGQDLDKALLLFADPPEIGEDGAFWLRMHLANTAGFDKETLDDRIKWTHDNEGLILATAAAPLDNLWWATDADSPFCFLAACFEYAAWKEQGPSYRCGLAIAFDGSCSGIQHFSAMLKDEVGGRAVNLIPSEKPSDIYRIVSDKVNIVLKRDAADGSEDYTETKTDKETGEITERPRRGTRSLSRQWLNYGVNRKVTKRSVMTLPYGSKKYGFTDQLFEDIVQPAIEEMGEDVFPSPGEACSYMAGLIWDALGTTVVAAVEAMAWLQKVAAVLVTEEMPCHWVTPAGFPVWQEYRKTDTHRIDTMICGNIRVTMTVNKSEAQTGPKPLDRHKQQNGISPNFVHSMDASHMMLTCLRASQRGIEHFATIHDSFGTAPGHAGTMFRTVREVMVETYDTQDVIQNFYTTFDSLLSPDARDKIPAFPEKGALNLQDILNSQYCFA